MNYDLYAITKACKCLVDRVIDNLINQVMQPDLAGRADIHCGAFANGVAAL
jgi:hypothetical protein